MHKAVGYRVSKTFVFANLGISPVLAYYFNKADSALLYTLLNYWLNLKILSIKLESSFLKPNMTV